MFDKLHIFLEDSIDSACGADRGDCEENLALYKIYIQWYYVQNSKIKNFWVFTLSTYHFATKLTVDFGVNLAL